jgi:hypothetical protein
MSLEADYAATLKELLASHLVEDGVRATVESGGVRLGSSGIVVEIRVDGVRPANGMMQVVYWATVTGAKGLGPFEVDLIGLGSDAHKALTDSVHVLLDQVLIVLLADADRSTRRERVTILPISSVTDRRSASWDLIAGPAGIGSEDREPIEAAIRGSALMQGLMDALTDSMADVRPHWYKLFLVRPADGDVFGDMKVDGRQVGVAPSFDSPTWPAGPIIVRQFGILRPANRPVSGDEQAALIEHGAEIEPRRSLWQRIRRN